MLGVTGMSSNGFAVKPGLLADFTTLPGTIGESHGAALVRGASGEDGGIAGSSKAGLRKKLCPVDFFSGVLPTTSPAGKAPFCHTFL